MTELVPLRETAARLGWPADRVRRMVKTGKMPAVRISRRYFFRPADVEAWIAAHTVGQVAPPDDQRDVALEAAAGPFAGRFR